MSEQQIYQHLEQMLVDQFEVSATAIRRDARLYEDLGIDSIDAVDMIVQLRELTGQRIPPEDFKSVRTVDDVVHIVRELTA